MVNAYLNHQEKQKRQLSMIKVFSKYCAAGGLATMVHYSIFIAIINHSYRPPWQATLLGAFFGAAASYILNYHYTFTSSNKHLTLISKFIFTAILGLFLQALIVAILSIQFEIQPFICQVIASLAGLIVTFFINYLLTFR